jgi:hypothetical protein
MHVVILRLNTDFTIFCPKFGCTGKQCCEMVHRVDVEKVKKLKHLHPFGNLFFCIEGMFCFDIMARIIHPGSAKPETDRVAVFAQPAGMRSLL